MGEPRTRVWRPSPSGAPDRDPASGGAEGDPAPDRTPRRDPLGFPEFASRVRPARAARGEGGWAAPGSPVRVVEAPPATPPDPVLDALVAALGERVRAITGSDSALVWVRSTGAVVLWAGEAR